MSLSLQDLQAEAAATGFLPETLDKVIRLIGLLDAFRNHPFLGDRVALKGGTALNLFVFDLPRLSVDIDLNYIGSSDRDVMLAGRENTLAASGDWDTRMLLAAVQILKSMWSSRCGFRCGR